MPEALWKNLFTRIYLTFWLKSGILINR